MDARRCYAGSPPPRGATRGQTIALPRLAKEAGLSTAGCAEGGTCKGVDLGLVPLRCSGMPGESECALGEGGTMEGVLERTGRALSMGWHAMVPSLDGHGGALQS